MEAHAGNMKRAVSRYTRAMRGVSVICGLVSGCILQPGVYERRTADFEDNDGDGLLAHEDCDDNDDKATDKAQWYVDEDLDGFGSDEIGPQCVRSGETDVLVGGDCDDGDADEGPNALWYPDSDGDGFGDPDQQPTVCERGLASDQLAATDCNDADALVHPGQQEFCNDGIDNNCDDDAGDCVLMGEWEAADVGFFIENDESNLSFGRSFGALADLNGDGLPELVVGAPTLQWKKKPQTFLFTSPLSPTMGPDAAAAVFTGENWSLLGTEVAGLGDINGDGIEDLAIGDSLDEGTFYVLHGPFSGEIDVLETSAARFLGSSDGNDPGGIVLGGYDFTQDGQVDLLVGGWRHSFLFPAPLAANLGNEDATATFKWLGDGPTALGDVDGDGEADVALSGCPEKDKDPGVVALFLGPLSAGAYEAPDGASHWLGPDDDCYPGYWLAGGADLSLDGTPDIVVGSRYDTIGRTRIIDAVEGLAGEMSDASAIIDGVSDGDHASEPVIAGDLDGDGNADLAIRGLKSPAEVFIFYGPIVGTGTTDDADVVVSGDHQTFAQSMLGPGDLDGDGVDDLVVGDPYYGDEAGRVLIISGGGL